MSVNGAGAARTAHVNMMTDTVITNLPSNGLRSIIRAQLARDPEFTSFFLSQARDYLETTSTPATEPLFIDISTKAPKPSPEFDRSQKRARSMMGCGLVFESLRLLERVVREAEQLMWDEETEEGEFIMDQLATIDGDIVQGVTAVQKVLSGSNGTRELSASEKEVVDILKETLVSCQSNAEVKGLEFMFERGLASLDAL
ncbi:MAG: hypothetical protein M1834_006974 [Cirrosporium novae-zelandiae]|nr:MAG: hypothetical protein M1834_006974 [Cirrosporium novae-zelandiae]